MTKDTCKHENTLDLGDTDHMDETCMDCGLRSNEVRCQDCKKYTCTCSEEYDEFVDNQLTK